MLLGIEETLSAITGKFLGWNVCRQGLHHVVGEVKAVLDEQTL